MQVRNMPYAFGEQLTECLVNVFRRLVCRLFMSATELLPEIESLADKRSFEDKLENLQDNMSAKEMIPRNTNMPKVGLFNS